ncbi:MAG: hypothetical protein R3F14_37165 [Polyangiaceae bacterium]
MTLEKTGTLKELLTHLYVLIPVLDDQHYWVGTRRWRTSAKGEGWLSST